MKLGLKCKPKAVETALYFFHLRMRNLFLSKSSFPCPESNTSPVIACVCQFLQWLKLIHSKSISLAEKKVCCINIQEKSYFIGKLKSRDEVFIPWRTMPHHISQMMCHPGESTKGSLGTMFHWCRPLKYFMIPALSLFFGLLIWEVEIGHCLWADPDMWLREWLLQLSL